MDLKTFSEIDAYRETRESQSPCNKTTSSVNCETQDVCESPGAFFCDVHISAPCADTQDNFQSIHESSTELEEIEDTDQE